MGSSGETTTYTMAPKKDAKKDMKAMSKPKAGAGAKKKWSKGKVREKLNNLVVFDQATYDRMLAEVKNFKLVTPSAISERLKVNSPSHAAPSRSSSKLASSAQSRPTPVRPSTPGTPVMMMLKSKHRNRSVLIGGM